MRDIAESKHHLSGESADRLVGTVRTKTQPFPELFDD